MNKLKHLVEKHQATIRPADEGSIIMLEKNVGFPLSHEYKSYLLKFGLIAFESNETYGLGVPEDYYLNANNIYADLSRDPSYPRDTVPLLEIGDGRYYLYNNRTHQVLLWATPNGGVVRVLEQQLEQFLIEQLFGRQA